MARFRWLTGSPPRLEHGVLADRQGLRQLARGLQRDATPLGHLRPDLRGQVRQGQEATGFDRRLICPLGSQQAVKADEGIVPDRPGSAGLRQGYRHGRAEEGHPERARDGPGVVLHVTDHLLLGPC